MRDRVLDEGPVAGLWCVAYATDDGIDVVAFAVRGGRPVLERCLFAGRRTEGRWPVVVEGKPSPSVTTWADRVLVQNAASLTPGGNGG